VILLSEETGKSVLLIKTSSLVFPLGIPVENIEELTRISTNKIHPVPRSKPLFRGITLLREQLIPILSLEVLLFKKPKKIDIKNGPYSKTKIPIVIINNNGIKIGFSFDDVIRYDLLKKKQKIPEKIQKELNHPDYCELYEINNPINKEKDCLFINLQKIISQFIEIKEEKKEKNKKKNEKTSNTDTDFDLDQFTLKEGESFDPSKLKI